MIIGGDFNAFIGKSRSQNIWRLLCPCIRQWLAQEGPQHVGNACVARSTVLRAGLVVLLMGLMFNMTLSD